MKALFLLVCGITGGASAVSLWNGNWIQAEITGGLFILAALGMPLTDIALAARRWNTRQAAIIKRVNGMEEQIFDLGEAVEESLARIAECIVIIQNLNAAQHPGYSEPYPLKPEQSPITGEVVATNG